MASLLNALIGEYRIVESLGAGGMGEVYKAVHTHLGRTIAIKVLSPALTDGPALARFYGEANIQARLKHPGVAEYLGFYEFQGRPCILMEYVDGETLASTIRRRGPLSAAEAVRVAREITAIVTHFHDEGLVHRDLKANNIKIDAAGRVRILDFGIARYQCSNRLTRIGAVIGTPEALSPEQVRGETATQATDVWQLGVMFYELLTGKAAFPASNTVDLYASILAADYPPVGIGGLDEIVVRCLQKNPAKRYRSAAELHAALCAWEAKQRSGAGSPRAAGCPPARPRVRLSREVRRMVLLSALSVALLSAVMAIPRRAAPEPPKPPAETAKIAPPSAPAPDLKTVTVDTADGAAQVFVSGKLVGNTPFQVRARAGERIELVLRRAGFRDLPVQFEVTERRDYTYTLQPLKED